MSTRRLSTVKQKEGETVAELKQKVKELEAQCVDYKRRLDELRKAKHTTITKREREIINVGGPNLGARRDSLTQEREDPRIKELEREIELLRMKHEVVLQDKGDQAPCNHEEEIRVLRYRVTELESDNAALLVENEDLRDRTKSLLQELSVKEAEWCEMEEKLTLKMKMSFGEKYAEWMQKTESKIEELQHANALMRTLLNRQYPGGSDPSRQDPT